VSGVIHGIPFEYTCGSTIRSTNFWGRRWSRARGLVGAVRRINRQRRAGPVEAVLLYSKSSLDAAVLHFASRGVRSVYIVDLCELPFPTPWGLVLGKVRRSVYNCTFFRWFDAAIVISDRLRRHAAAFGSRGMALLNAPVMVDTDEFRPMPGAAESPPVITYCGLLNEQKDGVATLIRVFARVASDVPQVRLRLIGDTYHGTRIPEFRAIAERLGIAVAPSVKALLSASARSTERSVCQASATTSTSRPTPSWWDLSPSVTTHPSVRTWLSSGMFLLARWCVPPSLRSSSVRSPSDSLRPAALADPHADAARSFLIQSQAARVTISEVPLTW
jgi:glycosyltransferase involved in cell wall biosynthesis